MQVKQETVMTVEITGDEQSAQEVLFKIKQWDHAICRMNIEEIIQLCEKDVTLFDVGSQLEGVMAYQEMWERYRPYFHDNIRVYRRESKVYAQPNLAFLRCYSKVDKIEIEQDNQVPWCRTTLCFEKLDGKWKVVHQHISMPVDFHTQKAVMLHF